MAGFFYIFIHSCVDGPALKLPEDARHAAGWPRGKTIIRSMPMAIPHVAGVISASSKILPKSAGAVSAGLALSPSAIWCLDLLKSLRKVAKLHEWQFGGLPTAKRCGNGKISKG